MTHARGTLQLVTGGARSGKSAFAEQLAGSFASADTSGAASGPIVYFATAEITDEEMERRVREHQSRRPNGWRTVESPEHLEEGLRKLFAEGTPVGSILIDCITVWISNLLLKPGPQGEEPWRQPEAAEVILQRAEALIRILKKAPCPVVVVTNEVGHALVPEYALGRLFRDLAGKVNQLFAAQADDVFYVVCGIPMNLKQLAWCPEPNREQGPT